MGAHKVAVAAILGLVAALILSVAPPAMAAHGDASGLYGGALRVSVRDRPRELDARAVGGPVLEYLRLDIERHAPVRPRVP